MARAEGARTTLRSCRRSCRTSVPISGESCRAALVLAAKLANLLVPLALKRIVDWLNIAPACGAAGRAARRVRRGARRRLALHRAPPDRVRPRHGASLAADHARGVPPPPRALSCRFHLGRRTGGVARDVERGGAAISDLLDWTLYTILPTVLEIAARHRVSRRGVRLELRGDHADDTRHLRRSGRSRSPSGAPRFYRAAVEADTRANERAVDSLLNYETVKYFNDEAHEAARYDENLCHLENARVKAQKTLAVLNLGQTAIGRDRRDRDDVARRASASSPASSRSATSCS